MQESLQEKYKMQISTIITYYHYCVLSRNIYLILTKICKQIHVQLFTMIKRKN